MQTRFCFAISGIALSLLLASCLTKLKFDLPPAPSARLQLPTITLHGLQIYGCLISPLQAPQCTNIIVDRRPVAEGAAGSVAAEGLLSTRNAGSTRSSAASAVL